MAGNNSIQFLRGTEAQRATHTEVSLAGQPIYCTDTNKLYVGNGSTPVNQLKEIGGSSSIAIEGNPDGTVSMHILSSDIAVTQSGNTISISLT